MKLFFQIIFLLLTMCPPALAEFLYPVACRSAEEVYVLYQKSLDYLELWVWDSVTKKASKALHSTFIPAGLQLLTDNTGYSFIDNDRIRIKFFDKRQPKALEFYDPIYDFNLIHWIDKHNFYFSAKEKEKFGIFHGTMYGTCHRILKDNMHDYMYPQRVGDTLFFIEKDGHETYRFCEIPYPEIPLEEIVPCVDSQQFEDRVKAIMESELHSYVKKSYGDLMHKQELLCFNAESMSFLTMISDSCGFVLEHPSSILKSDATIPFRCYCLSKDDTGTWSAEEIYSFYLPTSLIVRSDQYCLYESILPLLFRYDNKNEIYFVSSGKDGLDLDIFCYRLNDRSISKKTNIDEIWGMFFSPLISNFGVWYGGYVNTVDHPHPQKVCMWLDDEGNICLNLPSLE